MNNSFLDQFAPNIKFDYFCFDRVIIRGYIRHLFFAGGVAILLKVLGFRQMTTGVMLILTDQFTACWRHFKIEPASVEKSVGFSRGFALRIVVSYKAISSASGLVGCMPPANGGIFLFMPPPKADANGQKRALPS